MAFRISNNVPTLTATRHLAKSQRQVNHSLKALASGERIVSAGDDPAGFAIAQGIEGQLSGMKRAKFNAQTAKSLVQTAEGGLNEQNNILTRLRELAVYAASDTVGERERGFIDEEFQQLVQEFDRIAKSTRFGNKQLLSGSGKDFTFHVGADSGDENTIEFELDADTTADNVEISDLSVAEQDDAMDALEYIDEGLYQIAGARSKFGAAQSRFQHAIDHLSAQRAHLSEAKSLISDTDVAEEVYDLTRARVLQDMGTAVLAQANANSQNVLRLLSA